MPPPDDDADFGVATTAIYTMMMLADVAALGHGGLLEDVPERPRPRNRLE